MRAVNEMRGLRYPDEYVVRMFFKEQLDKRAGRVLELGCGSGNNLCLFRAYGWSVCGVDINAESLNDARHNLGEEGTELIQCDLSNGVPRLDASFDCILLPSVNYYIPRTAFTRLLRALRAHCRKGTLLYLRSRLPDDWRYGRGTLVEADGFRLTCQETGELGLLNVFYSENALRATVAAEFSQLDDVRSLHVRYDNLQSNEVIRNSDLVIWGRATGWDAG